MVATLVDCEAITIAYLKADTTLLSLVAARVGVDINATYPFIRLFRIAGTPDRELWADHARIQVEAWGRTRTEASHIARRTFESLQAMRGVRTGGVVTGVRPLGGIHPQFDPTYDPPQPRFIFDVEVTAHP